MTHVFFFGPGISEGVGIGKERLGGKGAGLAAMSALGIPVPPGFTIGAELSQPYADQGDLDAETWTEIDAALARLAEVSEKSFGTGPSPLLVSVRSGAAISMPGMMETVLNLGFNDEVAAALITKTGNPRFVYDAYQRFVEMYSNVVAGLEGERFRSVLQGSLDRHAAASSSELDAEALKELVGRFKELYAEGHGEAFPENPRRQLRSAIKAVFRSYSGDKASSYRRINRIEGLLGTAVNVQAMVFGNMGAESGTGVAFTRDPSTGENKLYGEFLKNAQGEDLVAGLRTPEQVSALFAEYPKLGEHLEELKKVLETHFRDMQDLEFTWEERKLYLLQTRRGKRSALAALRIAEELLEEGVIDAAGAVAMVADNNPSHLLAPVFDEAAKAEALSKDRLIAVGLAAGPGAARGVLVFDPEEAERVSERGRGVILARRVTSPEDICGMHVARGILTTVGGLTSHAAVVARGMGKPCVVGCSSITIHDEGDQSLTDERGRVHRRGDLISIDGFTGEVIEGEIPTSPSEVKAVIDGLLAPEDAPIFQRFSSILGKADELRRLGVRANADTPRDAENARRLGAEGIGLCRTEHMFFEGERIHIMRQLIVAEDSRVVRSALDRLLGFQREDFVGLFRAMNGFPVTIRLLDPPLHEFLPETPATRQRLASSIGLSLEDVAGRIEALHEMNPMLGFRGCRVGILRPEINRMQVQAIVEAAAIVGREGAEVRPEIMIPFVSSEAEMLHLRRMIGEEVAKAAEREGFKAPVLIGTMIEIPRAAINAGGIAKHADFFSFGTNDLTQMTFGISRDDAEKRFLPAYVEKGLLPDNPFATLDLEGVGELMKIAIERGRGTNPKLKIGLCGEHGGDPRSIAFCESIGLDYVSCSPFRVPIARLAAARAVAPA